MSMLDVALACVARGWYVLPIPRDGKKPIGGLVPRGVLDATIDEEVVRRWWRVKPDANVGIACGQSGLAVLDCDTGNADATNYALWADAEDIPITYTVRTGRRSCFGTHSYFNVQPGGIDSGTWERWPDDLLLMRGGEIRSKGYYILAAGSLHPESKQPYEVLLDVPIAPLPEHIAEWLPRKTFDGPLTGQGDLDALREGLTRLGLEYEDEGDKLFVRCPWSEEHSMYSGPSETALFIKNGLYCFKCHHSSCDGRGYSSFVHEVDK